MPHDQQTETVVVIGNCFSQALVNGMCSAHEATRRFQFLAIPLHIRSLADEQCQDWISSASHVFVQQLGGIDWPALTEMVLPSGKIHQFPAVVLRSPWPFGASNGYQDAFAKSFPQDRIRHFDGALARLRVIEPNKTRRFQVYRDLKFDWVENVDFIAKEQDVFLCGIDHGGDTRLGSFVNQNYRHRQLFYSSTHPSKAFFQELCAFAWRKLSLPDPIPIFEGIDTWSNWSVPVHPLIARHLGLAWADEDTRYNYRSLGRITWEEWAKTYIDTFG